nr:MAG TPA: integrase [Caudoviricetes sp.]
MTKVNCAVYVRKSTEKGLELEFNSLHNQEDACRSYIMSQAFNNWEYFKTYTDGGISGGTMERPALKQMLEDIRRGLIQTVVVYKVDRLSRSIMDFHNMMKEFDKYGCSFVSITQAFDTSTSMGKLTLNMLLSFAQFEREVSSERVRDKIRASKAKGLWTGGVPKLGYDIKDKKLVINPVEAEQVRSIFEGYLQCCSLAELEKFAEVNGFKHKGWVTNKGEQRGGKPFRISALHRLLHEKLYLGMIENKRTGQAFKGQHEAIISKDLWEKVQAKLKENDNCGNHTRNRNNNLLTGKLFDANGTIFTNQANSKKKATKRHYYSIKGLFLPTEQIDKLAKDAIIEILNSNLNGLNKDSAMALKLINFTGMDYFAQRNFIRNFINKIIYQKDRLTFFFNTDPIILSAYTGDSLNESNNPLEFIADNANNQIIYEKQVVINRGLSSNIYNAGKVGLMSINDNNHLIVRAFAYAWRYKKLYECGIPTDDIAKQERISKRTIYKYLNLAYLSPKLVNQLLNGTLTVNLQTLFEIASKNLSFEEQEKMLEKLN